jgi:hypothetical protein
LFYQVKDAFPAIRSSANYTNEGKTREKGENETENESRVQDRDFTAIERIHNRKETFDKLYTSRYRFMARFGKEAANPFDGIHWALTQITTASRMLATYWQQILKFKFFQKIRKAIETKLRKMKK